MKTIRKTYRLPLTTLQEINRIIEQWKKKGGETLCKTDVIIKAVDNYAERAGITKPRPCGYISGQKTRGQIYCKLIGGFVDFPSRCIKCDKT